MSKLFRAVRTRLRRNKKVYKLLGGVYGVRRNTVSAMARLRHGIDPNMVLFCAFEQKSYGDNPRYISEALHRLRPQTDIVWMFDDIEAAKRKYPVPDYVRCVATLSKEGYAATGRARVLVDNYNKRAYIRLKTPDQVYIQTWHGDRAFKKVGYDIGIPRAKMCEEKYCALGVCGSEYGYRQFRSAFHYKGEIMRCGYPRNDILVRKDPAEEAEIRARLGIDADTGVLLYAPTFRDSDAKKHRTMPIPLDLAHVLDKLREKTGKRWICLTRAHYLSYGIAAQNEDSRIISASDYPEMAELLRIADALITDYSSCAGDFALLRRPIFLYQDDLADYIENSRKLYFDMADSPYWVADTPEGLDALIDACTPQAAAENCEAILKFYGECESGRAAEQIAEYIIDKLKQS